MQKPSYANLVSSVLYISLQIYFEAENVMIFAMSKIPKTRYIDATGCGKVCQVDSFQHHQCSCFNGYLPNILPF